MSSYPSTRTRERTAAQQVLGRNPVGHDGLSAPLQNDPTACHPTDWAVKGQWADNKGLKRYTAIGPAAESRTSLNPPGERVPARTVSSPVGRR